MSNATKKTTPLDALNKAINAAGGRKQLADKIGLKEVASIGVMVNRDKKASAKYALKISLVTGVPIHELRPDLYPPSLIKTVIVANDATNSPNQA